MIMASASGLLASRSDSVPEMISAFQSLARCWSKSCIPLSPLAMALGNDLGSPSSRILRTTGVLRRTSMTGMRFLPSCVLARRWLMTASRFAAS